MRVTTKFSIWLKSHKLSLARIVNEMKKSRRTKCLHFVLLLGIKRLTWNLVDDVASMTRFYGLVKIRTHFASRQVAKFKSV